ncbi:MAG TPA: hypothetical protein VM913_04445 [Sphingomicrobium sp.]|jgi:hypothetical protein|nr:hypothetical protein [Sphingomicrobium sp.]
MIRVAIYWTLLAIVVVIAFRRGDRESRYAALVCLGATILTVFFLTPFRREFTQVETFVAAIDIAVLLSFVAIALRSVRFWPLWVSGLQLTTVMAHVLRLLRPDLVDLAYAAAMRFWSYPILLILVVAALRSRNHPATLASPI